MKFRAKKHNQKSASHLKLFKKIIEDIKSKSNKRKSKVLKTFQIYLQILFPHVCLLES